MDIFFLRLIVHVRISWSSLWNILDPLVNPMGGCLQTYYEYSWEPEKTDEISVIHNVKPRESKRMSPWKMETMAMHGS